MLAGTSKLFAFPAGGIDFFREAPPHESEAEPPVNLSESAVRQSLTALGGGKATAVDCLLRQCRNLSNAVPDPDSSIE